MAGTYNIHLADKAGIGEGTMYAVGLNLMDLFNQVCNNSACPYSDADYWWNTPANRILPTELLVYVLPNKAASLLAKVKGAKLGGTGTTAVNSSNGNLSEVYVKEILSFWGDDVASGLAVFAFHECMHNKLNVGDLLHFSKVDGTGLAKDILDSNDKLSSTNISVMARALDQHRPQDTRYL